MPDQPLSSMTPIQRAQVLAEMAQDRQNTATQRRTGLDARDYLHAVSAVTNALLEYGDLLGVSITVTPAGAINIALQFPGENDNRFVVYSPEPEFFLDIIALFTNLVTWVEEHDEIANTRLSCPLAGHSDTWDLAILYDHEAGRHPDRAKSIWRVCGTTKQRIGRFILAP